MALNLRQKRFVEAYLSTAAGNATEAYLQAGYRVGRERAASSGCLLLQKPDVQAYLQELQSQSNPTQEAAELAMEIDRSRLASADEVQVFFADIMRDIDCPLPARMKAGEVLARCLGLFAIQVNHNTGEDALERLSDALLASD